MCSILLFVEKTQGRLATGDRQGVFEQENVLFKLKSEQTLWLAFARID